MTTIVSKKIRRSAQGEDCTLRIPGVCNFDPETVVYCHLPSIAKGIGKKGNDIRGVYACFNCHSVLDRRVWDDDFEEVRWQESDRAWEETLLKLIEKGIVRVA